MKRSPFHYIYRVYENKVKDNITFELADNIKKEVHSLCTGKVTQKGYDKIYNNYVIIYSKDENKYYMYYGLDELCIEDFEEIEIGDIIAISNKVEVKIYEKCPCRTILFYYSYLGILNKNNEIIIRDGIYYNGG